MLSFLPVSGQRLVTNLYLFDIDDYSVIDTAIVRHNYHIRDSYKSSTDSFQIDSCIHYKREQFDSTGKLVELIKGSNLQQVKVDYAIKYKKLSDSLYETIVCYPPGSAEIPEAIYIDTVINKRPQRWCLYKRDKFDNIVMRSLYYTNHFSGLKIERYDLDNRLIQEYYPYGNRQPKRESWDSTITQHQKTVTYQAIYDENQYTSVAISNGKNRVLESYYTNKGAHDRSDEKIRTIYVYDTAGNLIIKTTLNQDNELIEVEQYIYKQAVLIRYTRDTNLSDNDVNEEQVWNESGILILSRYRSQYTGNENTWKYATGKEGLTKRGDRYENGRYQESIFYTYDH